MPGTWSRYNFFFIRFTKPVKRCHHLHFINEETGPDTCPASQWWNWKLNSKICGFNSYVILPNLEKKKTCFRSIGVT